MSLLDQAKLDAASILADAVSGFGQSLTLTDRSGFAAPVVGFFNDIHRAIDPETGMQISAQTVTFVVSISAIEEAGFAELPTAEMAADEYSWLVTSGALSWRVKRVEPDATVGALTLYLEKFF